MALRDHAPDKTAAGLCIYTCPTSNGQLSLTASPCQAGTVVPLELRFESEGGQQANASDVEPEASIHLRRPQGV